LEDQLTEAIRQSQDKKKKPAALQDTDEEAESEMDDKD